MKYRVATLLKSGIFNILTINLVLSKRFVLSSGMVAGRFVSFRLLNRISFNKFLGIIHGFKALKANVQKNT